MRQIDCSKVTYIAGPMSGYADWNFPAFFEEEEKLRGIGVKTILNPAANKKDPNKFTWKDFMLDAIDMVMQSGQIVFLKGWEKSNGAKVEYALGEGLGLPMFLAEGGYCPYPSVPESILDEADRLVVCDRGKDYGHPFHDFSRTGKMWAAILGLEKVEPEQVGLCMIALKMSRLCNSYKRDSLVDIAGYAKTIDMVMDKKNENMLK
jgi:hypothetical protein